MKTKIILFLIFLSLIVMVSLVGCKVNNETEKSVEEKELPPGESQDQNNGLDDPDDFNRFEDERELSPYSGLPVDEIFGRPYAIIIENLPKARPQSGLKQAELVYEVPVEGGISRFLAFYITPYENDIGPVRSARPYFAYLTKEQDGILAHCGYSIHTEAVLKEINLKHIDERYNSLYYKRLKSRNMPHNLYTSLSRLTLGAEKFNYLKSGRPEPSFAFNDLKEPDQVVSNISIAFSTQSIVEYRWNSNDSYTRYNDGQLFIDGNYGEPVEVKNIIVQFINTRTFTEEGHQDITLIGEGKGLLFTAGQVEEIKWRKNSYQEKTFFIDKHGRNIVLSRGNTWIHLVPQYGKVEWSF